MARFDVFRGVDEPGYLLDCQADILSGYGTRVVVPLLALDERPKLARLNPVFAIDDGTFVMMTQIIFAIPEQELGRPVASLREEQDRIMAALDMLLTGI
ncbi:MAG: CcdB family protein [Sphingomonadaceae bacterium]